MMRNVAIAFVALALALPVAALAETGSFARYWNNSPVAIRLDANFAASDNCQAALAANRGVPPGQGVGPRIIPVTIVVGPNPKGCGNSRVVRRVVTVTGAIDTELIQIFFVNPSGRILKIEKVAIATY
jgi:hypothetical protein